MKPSPTSEEDAARLTRKRQRVLYSCTECHRRKQKCNRETPCENCVSRRAPHLCIQYQPGYDSLDTEARISRLEVALDKGIQQVLDRLTALEENGRQGAAGRSSRTQLNGVTDEGMTTPAAAAATTHSEAEPRGFDPLAMTLPYDSASEKYAALHAHLYPGAKGDYTNRSRLLAPASRLLEELPEHDRCRRLLRLFFDNINELYMPLPADRLSLPLEALLRSGTVLKTDDLHLFSILASILAFAILAAPDDLLIDGPISRFEEARSLLDAAHLALLTTDTLQVQDLDKVLAWILLSRVFNIEDRTSDAYEAASRAVISAYAINLHREPKMAILSADEEDERRRVWLMVYFQEKSLSIILGRPSTIQDDLCTTLCPKGDKHDSSETANPPSQFYCYHVLAKLMGRVNVVVQKSTDGQSHLHDALQIDSDICALRQMLPPYIRQSEVHDENKLGNIVGDVSVLQHWAIASEIDALRIALHRPFLNAASVGNEQSRIASIQASSQSLTRRATIVRAFHNHYGRSRVPRWYAFALKQSQRFSLVLACCVSLLLNPREGDALELRAMIEEYMAVLPRRTMRSLQAADFRRAKSLERELKVLQLFLDRANRLSLTQPPNAYPLPVLASDPAPSYAVSSSRTLVEQALDLTMWPYVVSGEQHQQERNRPLVPPEQQGPTDGADYLFGILSQGNSDERELQNSLLEALGSIPWSFE